MRKSSKTLNVWQSSSSSVHSARFQVQFIYFFVFLITCLVDFQLNGKLLSKSLNSWLGNFSFVIASKTTEVLSDDFKHLIRFQHLLRNCSIESPCNMFFRHGLNRALEIRKGSLYKRSRAFSSKSETTKFALG